MEKLVVSCPPNGSHTSYFSQAVPGRAEAAPEALEQKVQQRTDRAPEGCSELKKLHTNGTTTRKVRHSGRSWRGIGGRKQRQEALALGLQEQVTFHLVKQVGKGIAGGGTVRANARRLGGNPRPGSWESSRHLDQAQGSRKW